MLIVVAGGKLGGDWHLRKGGPSRRGEVTS